MPFSGENKVFFVLNNQKQNKKPKTKKTKQKTKKKTNKEGLGPSEVALWATSPDP